MSSEVEYIEEQHLFHGFIPKAMGTRLDIMTVGTPRALVQPVWDAIVGEAERLTLMLNRFDPESEVSKVNKSGERDSIAISATLRDLIGTAVDYWHRTEGLFDITRGRMTELALNADGTLSLATPEVNIDFGGIAKGYLLSRIKERLLAAGVKTAFVDFGNSAILAIGRHPYGDSWKVSLPNPYSGAGVAEFSICDRALSTSGNTPGYTGHIIHPVTGKANVERKLVCVVDRDPLEAEVLSTVFMLADKGQRVRLERAFPEALINIYTL